MTNYLPISHADAGSSARRRDESIAAILTVGLLLFVDIPLPFIGSSLRVIAVLIFAVFVFRRSSVSIPTPFCVTMACLVPLYYLVPPLLHPEVNAHDYMVVLVFQMACVGAMILMARAISNENQRRQFVDMLIFFALASAALAILQRYGAVGALGRERWLHAMTASNTLRGAGLLSDPNFLAILFASIVPLVVNWRFSRLRWPALVVLFLGLNATNSRSGIIFAILALIVSIAVRTSSGGAMLPRGGRKAVALTALCLITLFAFNVGDQRDRVVEGLLIETGVHESKEGTVDLAAANSASLRREVVSPWIEVGLESLPFGAGIGAQDKVYEKTNVRLGAHNTFVHTLAQGGVIGLLISITTLICFWSFVRHRTDPFAIMGMVIVASGLVLSWPGMVFLVLPMGLADGIRAAQHSNAVRGNTRPGGLTATH